MKKVFAFSVVFALIFAVLGAHVSAAQTVPVDIWVDIKNGGTAVIITEVNCPLPDRSSMTLEDGQSEAFHIDFSEEGTYSYSIRIEPDDREIYFDDTVYRVKVYVTQVNGTLHASIVIYNEKTDKKISPQGYDEPCTVSFVNSSETEEPEPPDQTDAPTAPEVTEAGSEASAQQTPTATDKPSDSISKPQTGDDSRLDFYLLLAIIASAGLFMLSVFYYRSVVKEIKQR